MTAPARPNPIPDSYRRVTPCLTIQGAAKALDFYAAVFGATERMRTPGPGGSIVHAEIEIIYVEDVDAVIARAVELGATVQRPAADQFYGDRDGYIIDPFGHGWTIASHVEDVTPQELGRRMAELFG
jgi:PhnB protein